MTSPTLKISASRSLSLPLESNPILSRISQELQNLKSWEESSSSMSESISIGFSGIAKLYGCVGEFLTSPLTQQSLSLHQNDAFLTDLVHTSSRLLEACCSARQIALHLKKEASGNLPGDYFRARKAAMKSAGKLNASLKSVERDTFGSWNIIESASAEEGGERRHVSAVIRVLRCVSVITVSVLESLVSFLGMPLKKRLLPLISRVMRYKGRLSDGEESMGRNELKNADVAMRGLAWRGVASDVDREVVRQRLDELEGGMQKILKGLESLCSQLTRTRASLLEIFTL